MFFPPTPAVSAVMRSIASTWESAVCCTLLEAAFDIAPSMRSWQVEPSKGRSTQSRVFEGKILPVLQWGGRDMEWWGNSSPAEVFVEGKWTAGANQTHTALECSWQHITASRPTAPIFYFLFFSSQKPLLFFISYFFIYSLSPTPLVALYVFVSPAADCCSSNLCTRLGMFFMLFASLPVSAPPVSPLVHYLPPFIWPG